jgi:large subunit ribosomal protein L18
MLAQRDKQFRRKARVRTRIKKDRSGRIRLSVHRSNNHIYAQLIDDAKHVTLASASTLDKDLRTDVKFGGNNAAAEKVGRLIAERGLKLGLSKIVFDRGGYLYHGRVKALADAARAGGLNF